MRLELGGSGVDYTTCSNGTLELEVLKGWCWSCKSLFQVFPELCRYCIGLFFLNCTANYSKRRKPKIGSLSIPTVLIKNIFRECKIYWLVHQWGYLEENFAIIIIMSLFSFYRLKSVFKKLKVGN
jgi:hypothetical protein